MTGASTLAILDVPSTLDLITTYGKKIPGECSLCLRRKRAGKCHNLYLIQVDDESHYTLCSWCDVEEGQRWLW